MRFPPASPGLVRCPRCRFGAPAETWRAADEVRCPGCRSRLRVTVFPALAEAAIPRSSEIALPGEAECFFHAGKKAAQACARCGRFLCQVCDLPIGSRHLCPSCIGSGLAAGDRVPELITRRLNWGRFALSLALVPLLLILPVPFFFPLLLPTAAAALACALYGWRRPGSLVTGRARAAAVAAILLGLVELSAVAAFMIFIWKMQRYD